MLELADIEAAIQEEDDLAEVMHIVRRYARDVGVVRQSYQLIPRFAEPSSPRTALYTVGFPEGWISDYVSRDFRSIDPIARYTLQKGSMAYWQEALDACLGDPRVTKFAQSMHRHNLKHGFGVPLYGPNGRNAFSFFDFDIAKEAQDQDEVMRLRLLSQMAHQRICFLLEKERSVPALSDRENQVLRWIALGKSNLDIATILDISAETVRTYTQRIYLKLNASDRTSAAVKGLKLGIIGSPDS